MDISNQIKNIRDKNNLSQEEFANKINVSRQAVSKWETKRGLPDIENLFVISNTFKISLDELLKNSELKNKIIADSNSKKWHLLVIIFLIAILIYIIYFAISHKIYMIGFAISTLFMLGIEVRLFIREKIYLQKN
jgi:transcriptional regulator with XRE-family HTH domain